MSDDAIEKLCWFRARFGARTAANVGRISYSSLMISTTNGLPDGVIYLHGRITTRGMRDRVSLVIRNSAKIPGDDAMTILLAIHRQVEDNDPGEMSAARPIVLLDWLMTLFPRDRAEKLARMLNQTAFGCDGASDAQTS